jgi:preprotein translocase subunit SecA
MKAIADTLCAYYLIRGVVDKQRFTLEDIHLIAPSMKLKLSPVEGMEDEKVLKLDLKKKKKVVEKVEEKIEEKVDEKPGKMTYKQGKDFAIRKCLTLIDATHKEFLKTHKKKDDLCDCYLQAYHYLTKVKKTII